MEPLLAALHTSPAHTRSHAHTFSEGEHAMRVRALNQELAHVCEERVHVVEGLPRWHAWLGEMAAAFRWQLPACECAGCALSPIKPASCSDRTVSQHHRHQSGFSAASTPSC